MSFRQMLIGSWRAWLSFETPRVGPWWMQLVWTAVFSAVVAVGFTIAGFALFADGEGAWRNWRGWGYWYGINFVIALCVGYTIHALFEITSRLIGRERIVRLRGWQRSVYYAAVPITGAYIGWPFGFWLVGGNVKRFVDADANVIVGSLLVSVLISFLFHVYFSVRAKEIAATQRATEAQLRLLQAQIEPHFLFNTLANVVSLIDHDAPRAKQMLEAFTDYLRVSLTKLRDDDSTLGHELDMTEAYLKLLQTRMDERLRFRIDADDALRAAKLPPLLLQPLVENAIHHGLEPKIEGGEVEVIARRDGARLRLQVEDDGLGLDAPKRLSRPASNGVALVNLRERLRTRYGDDASLDIASRERGGTRATLTLPLDTAAA